MAKVGVILAGCGVYDGAEIHEAVLTLLALDRAGVQIQCMAPDIEQMHVINHLTEEAIPSETRNVLVEAARIARGEILDLADVDADELDAVIFPGGLGAAKNLFDYATKGQDCSVHPQAAGLIRQMSQMGKPMGFICISPVMCATVFRDTDIHPTLTIGNDETTAAVIEKMGAHHAPCAVDDCVVDEANKIVTTPAYMLGPSIAHIAKGIDKLVAGVLAMV